MAIGAHEGQKLHGTFQEQFSYLHDLLTSAINAGAATPEEYRGTLLQLLKALEALRIKNEAALMELERQKEYHKAAVTVCSMMGSLIFNVVDARTRERLRILEGYKVIQRREIAEDRERIASLRAQGQAREANELEQDVARREAELAIDEAMSLGSTEEVEITKQAVSKAHNMLGGILGKPPANPRTREISAVQEVVAESLKEVPVNEMQVIGRKTNE